MVVNEWVTPHEPKDFNLDEALSNFEKIEWRQTKDFGKIKVGDVLYIYSNKPVQAITWKCRVTDRDRPISTIDDSKYEESADDVDSTSPYLEIERIQRYNHWQRLSLAELNRHGLKGNVRGPRQIKSQSLLDYIHAVDLLEEPESKQAKDAAALPLDELRRIAFLHETQTPSKRIVSIEQIERSRYLAQAAKSEANGICQLCGQPAPFRDNNGEPYLEAHHIKWLSRGGADTIENIVALCPNCHKRIHILDDPDDVKTLKSRKALAHKRGKK